MTTRLDKALKRELEIGGATYTITIAPEGIKIVEKGRRNGQELTWEQLLRGEVTLSQDLADSIDVSKAQSGDAPDE
jgi:hypothetical protein